MNLLDVLILLLISASGGDSGMQVKQVDPERVFESIGHRMVACYEHNHRLNPWYSEVGNCGGSSLWLLEPTNPFVEAELIDFVANSKRKTALGNYQGWVRFKDRSSKKGCAFGLEFDMQPGEISIKISGFNCGHKFTSDI